MPKEQLIKGKAYRNFIAGGVWVSKDGKQVFIQSGQYYKPMEIDSDIIGKYVLHPWKGRVDVAEAVLTCFCPPKPKDGQKYMVGYKDGNHDNCDKANLEWVPYQSQPVTMANSFRVVKNGKTFTVCKDGTIMNGKQKEHVSDCIGDADTDTTFILFDPTVSGNRGRIKVDDLMAAAGYVNGDKTQFISPVILHKDYDWKNFASDNLEWVDGNDTRVAEYEKQKLADRRTRWQEENPGLNINEVPYKI